MGNISIRNLPDEVHDHLRFRASGNNRSLEAEVRSILIGSYIAHHTGGFGQQLRQRFSDAGLVGFDFESTRDETPGRAADFS